MKELELNELVFVALGEASMCWSETPKGIFDTALAIEIGVRLIADIKKLMEGNEK